MKKSKQFIVFILLFLILTNTTPTNAQVAPFDSLLVKALSTDELLPRLIDSAIKYSPEVSRLNSITSSAKENLLMNKNYLLSAFSVNSSYNYGTNFSAINGSTSSNTGTNSFTTAQTGYYNVGVGFQLPLTHIINRKHLLRSGKAQVEVANSQVGVAVLSIKQEVIRLYQEFKLTLKLVAISTKNKQSSEINYAMVEKDFVQGQVTVVQLSSVLENYNKSVIDFEINVNKFQTAYLNLETYTNTELSTLLKQVK